MIKGQNKGKAGRSHRWNGPPCLCEKVFVVSLLSLYNQSDIADTG